jgi:hypothetical protein
MPGALLGIHSPTMACAEPFGDLAAAVASSQKKGK